MEPHVLDRPVWQALTSRQAGLALGDARAWRMEPRHGPFAAAADASAESLAALGALVPEGGELYLVEGEEMPPPPGIVAVRQAVLTQMVAEAIADGPEPDFVSLGEGDAAEMLALATLTAPGPFLSLSHRLGDFIGVKADGRLVAMAGERMRPDGFIEVSGVCTHPDWRGRGYAGGLMRVVSRRILAQGEAPYLHAYASNTGAIALYEKLGFRRRRDMAMTVIARG